MSNNQALYSLKECYFITYSALRSMPHMVRARKHNDLSTVFIEKIMLAVTEVNNCRICSYAHARIALEAGVPEEEIQLLLSGKSLNDVPNEELKALLFAQHYAESRGKPSAEAWEQIMMTYDKGLALGILASIRIIMWGNAYGIPIGSITKRFKGEADERSNLFYEITTLLSVLVFVPCAMVHALIARAIRIPIIRK